jgi:hypothetical protein
MISHLFCFPENMSSNFPSCISLSNEDEEEEVVDATLLAPAATAATVGKNLSPIDKPNDEHDDDDDDDKEDMDNDDNNICATEAEATAAAAASPSSNDINSSMMIMTPDEEEKWLGKYFSTSSSTCNMEDHMSSLEKEFEESMHIASSIPPSSSKKAQEQKLKQQQDSVRKVYAELHSQADPEIIDKLRMAMECIPASNCKGLNDCKNYFSSKQHYTLQDILVAQYILNDGLLMRQNHGTDDEYHVDIAEPLV